VQQDCGHNDAFYYGITDAFGQCGSYRGRAAANVTGHALLKRAALY